MMLRHHTIYHTMVHINRRFQANQLRHSWAPDLAFEPMARSDSGRHKRVDQWCLLSTTLTPQILTVYLHHDRPRTVLTDMVGKPITALKAKMALMSQLSPAE